MSHVKQSHHVYRRIACRSCGSWFDVPLYCGNRFCAVCGGPRRRRIQSKLRYVLSNLKCLPGESWKLVTLTIPDVPDLCSGAKLLFAAFRRLRQRRFWLNRIRGGFFVLETTGRPGRWHLHIHCICIGRYLPVRDLSRHWSRVSPGRIVYVQRIPIYSMIKYVTKYCTKSDLEPEYQLHASRELRNVRLFTPFGVCHSISLAAPKILHTCTSCGYDQFFPLSEPLYSFLKTKKSLKCECARGP
jgi:hypothetical protein